MKNKNEFTIKELCDMKYQDKNLVIPLGYANKKKLFFIDFSDVSGLFITGTTGTGKSVFIDDLIVGLMHKNNPSQIKFLMLDPKKVELGEYNGINYLLDDKNNPSLKNKNKVLLDILKMLEYRIKNLVLTQHRSINGYNRVEEEKWPHIFIVVDEGSDIIKMKDTYEVFSKVLDFGQYVGVHLLFATNSYLKDYSDSNFIKKFDYRITFDLASLEQEEYIDIDGSSSLKGEGNALIKCSNGKVYKFKSPYVKDEEINEVVKKNR